MWELWELLTMFKSSNMCGWWNHWNLFYKGNLGLVLLHFVYVDLDIGSILRVVWFVVIEKSSRRPMELIENEIRGIWTAIVAFVLTLRIFVGFNTWQLVYLENNFAINVFIFWLQIGTTYWVIMRALVFRYTCLTCSCLPYLVAS